MYKLNYKGDNWIKEGQPLTGISASSFNTILIERGGSHQIHDLKPLIKMKAKKTTLTLGFHEDM